MQASANAPVLPLPPTQSTESKLLLKAQDVAALLSISKSMVWRLVATGQLPPPLKIAPKCSRWRYADIQRYTEQLSVSA